MLNKTQKKGMYTIGVLFDLCDLAEHTQENFSD
jgi:hypothetical protein